jgi:hypothetical protein
MICKDNNVFVFCFVLSPPSIVNKKQSDAAVFKEEETMVGEELAADGMPQSDDKSETVKAPAGGGSGGRREWPGSAAEDGRRGQHQGVSSRQAGTGFVRKIPSYLFRKYEFFEQI